MWPAFWQAAVLIAFVWLIDMAIRRRVWPEVRYALWLLILVKLVLPPSFSLPTSLTAGLSQLARPVSETIDGKENSAYDVAMSEDHALEQSAAEQELTGQHNPAHKEPIPLLEKETARLNASPPPDAEAMIPSLLLRTSLRAYGMLAWLCCMVALAVCLIAYRRRLIRVHTVNSGHEATPPWLDASARQVARQLGLRRLPRIIYSRHIASPAVFGMVRPVLLIPAGDADDTSREDMAHVLLHELAHIKRGDLWVHGICMVLQVVYCFNPLLLLVGRQLRHLSELGCDTTVARILRERTPAYRETILRTARRMLARPVSAGLGLLGLFENPSRLLVRLRWLEKKTWRFHAMRTWITVFVIAAMVFCVLPMASKDAAPQPAPNVSGPVWPCFRGPEGNGVASSGTYPTDWDGKTGRGILWKSPVPLPGHSSPVIAGDRLFVSGGRKDRLAVYCYDANNGKLLWRRPVSMTKPETGKKFEVLPDTGFAAPTMVTDGQRACAIFATGDIACFDCDGALLWKLCLGIPENVYGHASSLALSDRGVVVQYDQGNAKSKKSRIMTLDIKTGNAIWETSRPVGASWASPIVVTRNGKQEIMTCADPWVIAYDAETGGELWRAECLSGEVAPSPTFAGNKVYAVAPDQRLVAIQAGGSGDVTDSHVLWSSDEASLDVCTPVSHGDWVYTLASYGCLSCFNVRNGNLVWEEDLEVKCFASPSLAGDALYLLGRDGTIVMLEAGGTYKILGKSALGEKCYASPAFVNGRIYIRGAKHIYCITGEDMARQAPEGGRLVRFNEEPPAKPSGSWPRFRGKDGDAIYKGETALARTLPADGPPVLWSVDVCEGYAGAAIHGGRVYVVDHDPGKREDVIRCLSFETGEDIWQYRYPVDIKRNHGMSRAVPAVTDRHLVAIGPKCHVTCLDPVTGNLKWHMDLAKDFKAKVPPWYNGQCPLIDDGKAIIAVGGDTLVMAVDCETGKVAWESGNPGKWAMTHSSMVAHTFLGRKQYIYCADRGVAGIDAESGRLRWRFKGWRVKMANVPAPVPIGEGRFFLTGGYEAGSMVIQLREEQGGAIGVEKVSELSPDVFGARVHTPIFHKGHIYGIRSDGQLVCMDLDGHIRWTSGKAQTFGLGSYIMAGEVLYLLNDDGMLTMVEAAPAGFNRLAHAKVLEGPESWGAMAAASGRIILRDLNKMVCLDMTGK